MARIPRITYIEKLKDPRWQKKRLQIFERDGWACVFCESKNKTLVCHHLYYLPGREPWDYSNEALATLCEECHEMETEYRSQSETELLMELKHWTLIDIDGLANVIKDGQLTGMMVWGMIRRGIDQKAVSHGQTSQADS